MPIEPAEEKSNHFVVLCLKYPEFSFNVTALRRYRKQRDSDEHAKGTVNFHSRVLDTEEQGFDEEEARITLDALKRRLSAPLWGVDIVEKGVPTLSETSDGRFTCGSCVKKYATMEGLTKHYNERHNQAA